MLDSIVFLFAGAALGFIAGLFFQRSKSGKSDVGNEPSIDQRKAWDALQSENGRLSGKLEQSLQLIDNQQAELTSNTNKIHELLEKVSTLESDNAHLEGRLSEQKQEMQSLNERFKSEFQNLAGEILMRNTKEFSQSNQKQLGDILTPLRERIERFEKRVNDVYSDESKSRSELMGQVSQLMELNKRISEEANNLTNALKGDTKKQGAWGELILEKILENSGLEKGREYETQVSNQTEEGLFRPDVLIKLPGDKCVIVDSKVSLIAFEAFVNAENDEIAEASLKQHLVSLRQHVKGLSGKDYTAKMDGHSLDFVLMFVPIEAGFSEALKRDHDLYDFAWSHRIVIVSPTTLLATLRTIASVWKHEKQNRNVIEIAEESGKLYDKFVLFLQDFEKIKRGLDVSNAAYDVALKKMQSGSGNLIRRAEKIKALGAKTSKSIEQNFLDQSAE